MGLVSPAQALDLARSLFRGDFQRLNRGLNNWVFCDENNILTIPRHLRVKDYGIRVTATRILKSSGVPVAEIREYSPRSDRTPEYLFVEKLKGKNIELSRMTSAQREMCHSSAGEVLRQIHSIFVQNYGRLDERGIGTSLTWKDFVRDYFIESFDRLSKNKELLERYGSRIQMHFDECFETIGKWEQPIMLHADYHLNNLYFRDNKVVGVLDLDLVSSGDPSWDTGHYCRTFNFDRKRGVFAFRRSYGRSKINPSSERAYSLIIWTRKLGSQAGDRPEALRESISEFEKILEGIE